MREYLLAELAGRSPHQISRNSTVPAGAQEVGRDIGPQPRRFGLTATQGDRCRRGCGGDGPRRRRAGRRSSQGAIAGRAAGGSHLIDLEVVSACRRLASAGYLDERRAELAIADHRVPPHRPCRPRPAPGTLLGPASEPHRLRRRLCRLGRSSRRRPSDGGHVARQRALATLRNRDPPEAHSRLRKPNCACPGCGKRRVAVA